MKNMILGDMSGYFANQTWESNEYRLNTLEVEPEGSSVTQKLTWLAALGNFFRPVYQSLFNAAPRKVSEGKVQP